LTEYWSLDPDRDITLEDDEAYAERFQGLFTEAVRCRLRSTGPIGSTLSGGLDSSSVVVTADDLLGDADGETPLHTFAAVFDPETLPESDESEFIEAVLDAVDADSHFLRGDQLDPLGDIETILHHAEDPYVGNNSYLHWNIHRTAGQNGVQVVLDGLGGDTTISHGMGYLPELAARGRWLQLAVELRSLNRNFEHVTSMRGLVMGHVISKLAPRVVKRAWHRLKRREFHDLVNPVFDADFLSRPEVRERFDPAARSEERTARQRHHSLIRSPTLVAGLERMNKVASAYGVEPRFPFLDRRLMEFCLALPPDQKIRGGWTRVVLRRAMEGRLPEKVRTRSGKGN
jgi:asparagine synthase (glutamine-hydrolysing)